MKCVNYRNGNRQINPAKKYVVAHVKEKQEKKRKFKNRTKILIQAV